MISPVNVKGHIWQKFTGFPPPSRGRHLSSCPCIQSSFSRKLPWNSGGFHLTAESAGHAENQERRQNSMCRTQNGTTESIPQTITTQPFFIQFETFFLLMKLNLQQTVTGATAHIARTSMSTKCPRGQIQHRLPILTEKCGNAREPCDKAGFTKTKRPTGPHSWDRKGHSSSLNMSSTWVPILWKERYKSIVCEMGGPTNADFRAGLDLVQHYLLGPWHNTAGKVGQR